MLNFLEIFMKLPAEVWVGFVGIIFGSLLTTFGVWLTNRANAKLLKQQLTYQEKTHNQKITKERLEELYVLVCHWSNRFFGNFLHLRLVIEGVIDYNQYLDLIIKNENSPKTDFSRIEMILGIYGAQLTQSYNLVLKERDLINEIEAEHKLSYKNGKSGEAYLKPLTDSQLKLAEAFENLKIAIAHAARNA